VAIKVDAEEILTYERARFDEQSKKNELQITGDTSKVNYNDLMGRIRHHILIHRIRVNCQQTSPCVTCLLLFP
jgi:hypothetical protein